MKYMISVYDCVSSEAAGELGMSVTKHEEVMVGVGESTGGRRAPVG